MMADALRLAALGWRVFPIVPRSKVPATPHGCKDATTDAVMIRQWWQQTPDLNIGVATGSGLYVIDLDGQEGIEAWVALEHRHEEPRDTPVSVVTGTGGRHLYYSHPGPLPNTAGKLGVGIDTRGDGGYVLAPPSTHPNGHPYRWGAAPIPPLLLPAQLPAWVVDAVRPNRRTEAAVPARITGRGSRYGQAVLDACVDRVRRAPLGQRNDTLSREAFKIGQLVGGGEIDPAGILELLVDSVPEDGDPRKTRGTAERQLREGLTHPRSRKDFER